mmetsp:Transcript_5163/g.9718  ORF Transcript_5163/g.9718 Transcript_5163/m.9718 type:complete len:176 (+) Transcript_5163:182-709(+)
MSLRSAAERRPVRQCRICLEEETERKRRVQEGQRDKHFWVAPCSCTGSRRWVHKSCLESWQRICLENKKTQRKARRCVVCTARYFPQPPQTKPSLFSVSRWMPSWHKLFLWPVTTALPAVLLLQAIIASLVLGLVKMSTNIILSPFTSTRESGQPSNTRKHHLEPRAEPYIDASS